jgi:hypothetical protein
MLQLKSSLSPWMTPPFMIVANHSGKDFHGDVRETRASCVVGQEQSTARFGRLGKEIGRERH